ncbi:MAG: ribonuclease Y [Candidatus Krumholzibacteriota bacterium]|nr:ribonuclease Y [Candidatus Krumholzibacteriota bacterium]
MSEFLSLSPGALLAALLFLLIGATAGFLIQRLLLARSRRLAADILADAQGEAERLRRDANLVAREERLRVQSEFDDKTRQERQELDGRAAELERLAQDLARRAEFLAGGETEQERARQDLARQRARLAQEQERLDRVLEDQNARLQQISGLSRDDARQRLLANMEEEARHHFGRRLKDLRAEAERAAKKEGQRIITMAIQRYAAAHCAETTVSVVELPGEEMKGRIIGREGRNIRAFESATGVDVIIDDTPGAVILSGFNPFRREIARLSLERLIADGRIHPTRIEEIVLKTREDLASKVIETGEQALYDLDVHGVHTELVKLLGELQYRSSYGQNALAHSREVAALSGLMAAELDLDPALARRAGLLHDIGKALDHEMEGTHAAIGAQIAERHGENAVVVNAIAGHHEEIEPTNLVTWLVSAADAISSARPGARRESLEHYVKRLQRLEEIADGFHGVETSYAIQAGRELRIVVNAQALDDEQAATLSYEIARRIESELEYPGEIKVVVIRETRATDTAR